MKNRDRRKPKRRLSGLGWRKPTTCQTVWPISARLHRTIWRNSPANLRENSRGWSWTPCLSSRVRLGLRQPTTRRSRYIKANASAAEAAVDNGGTIHNVTGN